MIDLKDTDGWTGYAESAPDETPIVCGGEGRSDDEVSAVAYWSVLIFLGLAVSVAGAGLFWVACKVVRFVAGIVN